MALNLGLSLGLNAFRSGGAAVVTDLPASGGEITVYEAAGTYKAVHTFWSSGSLVVTSAIASANRLLVGGGASGGRSPFAWGAGGGSGGDVLTATAAISAGTYAIVIGAGAASPASTDLNGLDGGDSTAFGDTAEGGSGGAASDTNGNSGRLGGGGAGTGLGGAGTKFDGGDGAGGSQGAGGGGAGAGGAGVNAAGGSGGNGGAGVTSSIFGAAIGFGGGGGGNDRTGLDREGNGVDGGGGGLNDGAGGSGVLGGGGGGSGNTSSLSGAGGKGLFIVSYSITEAQYNARLAVAWTPKALFTGSEEGALFLPENLWTLRQNSELDSAVAVAQLVGATLDLSGNGNNATQATVASKPILRQTGGGLYYLEDDETDDALNWTAPAGTYTVARLNSAGTVTIQTSQALSGATDILLEAEVAAYVAVDRALTAGETSSLTTYLEGLA